MTHLDDMPGVGSEYDAQLRGIMTGDESADEAEIKEVCLRETWGNHFGDPDLWASCWLHRNDCSLTGVVWDAGLFAWTGWLAIQAAIRPDVEARALGLLSHMPFHHGGHRIVVDGDMAWSTFTETNWHASDRARKAGLDTIQYRVLERHEGLWQIVHLFFVPAQTTTLLDRALIQIDGAGRIANICAAAKDALAGAGLTISAGRLRATQSKWDRELQATISRLNGLNGLAKLVTGSLESAVLDRPLAREFPVMLGEDEDGGQRHCVVMIQDGKLFVALDGPAQLDRRLRLANVVYGLTDTQMRLVREIVGGSSIPAAAEKLQISVNTARTHRNRIFDKIGVNNQAALVRCMLSVGG